MRLCLTGILSEGAAFGACLHRTPIPFTGKGVGHQALNGAQRVRKCVELGARVPMVQSLGGSVPQRPTRAAPLEMRLFASGERQSPGLPLVPAEKGGAFRVWLRFVGIEAFEGIACEGQKRKTGQGPAKWHFGVGAPVKTLFQISRGGCGCGH